LIVALPDNFSPVEHLLDTLRVYHNKLVREEFSDIEADDSLDIPRGSLKRACLLTDDDTVDLTILRFWLFFVHTRKASDFHPPIYGIPSDLYQESALYKPQVQLHFWQDPAATPSGLAPARTRVSFRIHNETSETLTPAKAQTLANKIRTEFMTGNGYRFSRGKKMFVYKDKERGYNFRMLMLNESDARELISKVHNLRSHTPNWDNLSEMTTNKTFPENPGNHIVYGKSVKKIRHRPTAMVRFRSAELHIHGLANPVILNDMTGYHKTALEKAF
jgi:hypothetical protein